MWNEMREYFKYVPALTSKMCTRKAIWGVEQELKSTSSFLIVVTKLHRETTQHSLT